MGVSGSWKHVPSDHCLTACEVPFSFPNHHQLRSYWCCFSRDDAIQWAKSAWPVLPLEPGSCLEVFVDFLLRLRDRFADKRSASQRRSLRFPFSLRLLIILEAVSCTRCGAKCTTSSLLSCTHAMISQSKAAFLAKQS